MAAIVGHRGMKMRADVAISRVTIPHRGRFVECRVVTSTVWSLRQESFVHLVVQRKGGPSIVLRLSSQAAIEIARDMLIGVDSIVGTSFARNLPV